ncbi:MAG: aldo/keto reductase [Candidatus Omnitrophica bacterium]|nr:aldo/keto reductase [Candidatus Omnitrophota bacterium]
MKYSLFPETKVKVSSIGLGTWALGGENWGGARESESLEAVAKAIELGMNFIDLAPFYGDGLAETIVGKAIRGQRDKVFIATKCGIIRSNSRVSVCLSPASIAREIDLSRRRLGVDVIDLYQCHWPDDETPVERTMEALTHWQNAGAIRHIGVSNFDVDLLKRACVVAPVRTLQIQYSLLERSPEKELLPFCIQNNIGVIVYGAMAGGFLTGKYHKKPQFEKSDARHMFYKFYEDKKFNNVVKIVEDMKKVGRPLNQVAINWARGQQGVMTVLAGCRRPAQVVDNAAASDWDLEWTFNN